MGESMIRRTNTCLNVDFLLLTALHEEYAALVAKFNITPYKYSPLDQNEKKGHRINLFCHDFVFQSSDATANNPIYRIIIPGPSGMGCMNAANSLFPFLEKYSPRYIILVGISGGNPRRNVNLGDLVIPDLVLDLQQMRVNGRRIDWRHKELPNTDELRKPASTISLEMARKELKKEDRGQFTKSVIHQGARITIASSNAVVASPALIRKW
jgi:nucleoside phosphorylase